MIQTGAPLAGSYDYGEVARSILVAITASYAALDLGGRVTAARGWARAAWLTGGAIAMGIGIWAMHFKALLAFRLPVTVDYHWPTVLVSLLIGVLSSAIALYVATRQKMGPVQAWTGSLIMGGGIAAMHYVGVAAMRLAAVSRFNPLLVALSALLAILFSRIALMFAFDYREDFRGTSSAKLLSAGVMGGAISLMHYTGMAAARFVPTVIVPNLSHSVSISPLGGYEIFIVTLLVLGTAILTSSMDRQAQMECWRLNERLEQRVVERTRELTAANEELRREIVERQRAKDALQQSEDHLRLVLDTTPALINSARPDGYLDYFNKRGLEYVGLPLEAVQGSGWKTVIHPEDLEAIVAKWRACLANGKAFEHEARMRRADGEYRWRFFREVPLRDEDGNIVKWYGSSIDIEDRKRAEEARRYTEEQYRKILETATDAVISIDEVSQILFVNPATTKIFGYDSSELVGRPLTMLMPDSMRELHEAGVRRYLTTNQRHMNWQGVELIGLRKTGEKFPVGVSFGEITKEGRRIFTGFIRDITERKRAEEALRRSEERYRLIVENQTEFIVKWLPDGTRTFVNENYCRMFGIAEADCLGTSFYPLVDPGFREGIKREVAALTPGKPEFMEEHPSLLPDGQHWQQWMTRGIFDASGNLMELLSAGRDITQLKRAEEKLRQLSGSLLRSQDKERRRIARELHDSTGQNLVALATLLGQLRASIPSAKRKSRRLLADSKALADKCIREVRTLSYVLHPPALDQAGLGAAVRDYVGGFTKRSGIHVEVEVPPNVGRLARDIELVLFRVVQESLTNIQRHSGSLQAKIRVNRNSGLTLEISDLGRGVSAGLHAGNEEPRFQVGVGIPSMQERVKLIGGRLDIDSTNQGTTVRVTIPLREKEREKTSHSNS